jgi:magnesium-protoporphyrin O-methyltransferase
MGCGGPCCYDDTFDAKEAASSLASYRRHGPNRSTRQLIEGLAEGGVEGATILDIGAGVGAVHLELLELGAASAVDVDASGPFLDAAREEAERRGRVAVVRHRRGDFVVLAEEVEPADLVALDRVVCCYGDMVGLVGAAAARTRRRLGIVVPREWALLRVAAAAYHRWADLRRLAFRPYIHRRSAIETVAVAEGLRAVSQQQGLIWQTLIFERAS